MLPAVATMAAPAVAQAGGTSVTAAIKRQDMVIKSSAAAKEFHDFHATSVAQAKPLLAQVKPLVELLRQAATVVSSASASTPQQKQGQQDWVKGIREAASGSGQIQVEFKDLAAGKIVAAQPLQRRSKGHIARAKRLPIRARSCSACRPSMRPGN